MPDLPAHASVVVIGGGVMGCSTLYHPAKDGVSDAILFERIRCLPFEGHTRCRNLSLACIGSKPLA